jgi:two-component system, response regulator PdtaR
VSQNVSHASAGKEKELGELDGLKVLIVDDDTDLAETLSEQLQSAGMHVVGISGDGNEALQLASIRNPDLIIMDIKLPGMDGIEVAHAINRQDPKPILFLSAYSDTKFIKRVKEMGALTYVVKPVTLKKILPSIVLTMERFREMTALRAYVDSMKEDMENRRLIERAKDVLMRCDSITENEAHERLRRQSQSENKPVVEIARGICGGRDVVQDA